MKKVFVITSTLLTSTLIGLFLSATAFAGLDERGDRIENRLDNKSSRLEHRLDNKGDRINNRLDRRAARRP